MAKTYNAQRIESTSRSLTQDAELAMKGDIFRGIVELVTNSDDAYGSERDGGEINILVDFDNPEGLIVKVHDLAKGLSWADLEKNMMKLGQKASGHADGKEVRGLFGRGAKDVAIFGKVTFETIRRGKFSALEIDGTSWDAQPLEKDEPATTENRLALNIPEGKSGFCATITCSKKKYLKFLNMRQSTFVNKIRDHVQLRQVSQRRDILLMIKHRGVPAVHEIKWERPPSKKLLSKKIKIPGFETEILLNLFELKEPSTGAVNEYSQHGIEIRGGKATYENTFFSLPNSPETQRIYGFIEADFIDDLLRDYENNSDIEGNDSIVVKRNRDGLERDHEFTKQIAKETLRALGPLLEGFQSSTDVTSESLQDAFGDLAKELRSVLLEEMDEEPEPIGPVTEDNPLQIIPPLLKLPPGTKKTMTVLAHKSLLSGGVNSKLDLIPMPGNASSDITVAKDLGEFKPHTRLADTATAVLQIKSNKKAEIGTRTSLFLTVNDRKTSATIEVAPEKEVLGPEDFEWKNASMSVTRGKERSVTLRAPSHVSPHGPLSCKIEIDGENKESGCVLLDREVELQLTGDGWLEGKVRVKGVSILETGQKIIAHAKGLSSAEGVIRVTKPTGIGDLIDVKVVPKAQGGWRGQVEQGDDGVLHVEIFGHYPAMKNSYRNDPDSPVTRTIIGETIATVLATHFIETKGPDVNTPPSAVLAERDSLIYKFLPIIHRVLVENKK